MKWFSAIIIVIAAIAIFAFQRSQKISNQKTINNMSNFTLESPEFKNNGLIPKKFTCDGENINPKLEFQNIPEETKSLVLIMDDPDATGGITWDHWLIWNIDPKRKYIEEDEIPKDAVLGSTSFGEIKYGGPCPPKGNNPHRYMFKLYALDTKLNLSRGALKSQLENAMEGHILDQTVLIGLYGRK